MPRLRACLVLANSLTGTQAVACCIGRHEAAAGQRCRLAAGACCLPSLSHCCCFAGPRAQLSRARLQTRGVHLPAVACAADDCTATDGWSPVAAAERPSPLSAPPPCTHHRQRAGGQQGREQAGRAVQRVQGQGVGGGRDRARGCAAEQRTLVAAAPLQGGACRERPTGGLVRVRAALLCSAAAHPPLLCHHQRRRGEAVPGPED